MIDQSFFISSALALGCGVGIGWIIRGVFRSRAVANGIASQVS